MKRWIALLLVIALFSGLCPAFAEGSEEGHFGDAEENEQHQENRDDEEYKVDFDKDGSVDAGSVEDSSDDSVHDVVGVDSDEDILEELRVGNPTPMDGKFFTGCWGNATSDIDVRTLVHGYRLVAWDGEYGMFRENRSAVKNIVVTEDAQGDREYFFGLWDDLYYSDGSPITAWDYAFSALFQSAPVLAELGALPMNLEYLAGYEEYASGETNVFSGIRVYEPYLISFQVKKEYLPYFFELYRFAYVPYPIHEIAPGCRVYDDGEGCYIDNENLELPEKLFSAKLLEARSEEQA